MKGKKTVFIIALTCLLNMVLALNHSWSLYESALHDLEGWSHTSASLPITIFSLCYCLFVTPTGLFNDKYGPRRTIFFGAIIAGCGLLLSSVTMTVPGIVIGFGILYPLGMVGCYTANIGNGLRWVPAEKRGTVSGIIISAIGVSGIISSQVSSAVISSSGVSRAFMVLLLYSTPVIMLGSVLLSPPPEKSDGGSGEKDTAVNDGAVNLSLRQTIRTRRFYLLVGINILGGMASSTVTSHIVNISKLQAGLSSEAASIYVTVVAVCNFVGRLTMGIISDRVPRKYILCVMYFLEALTLGMFRFFDNGLLIGMGISIITLTSAALMVMIPVLVTDFFGPRYYGQNYGIVNTFSIVNSAMPLIVGMIIDNTGSYNGAFLLGTVLSSLAFAMALLLPKTGGKRKPA